MAHTSRRAYQPNSETKTISEPLEQIARDLGLQEANRPLQPDRGHAEALSTDRPNFTPVPEGWRNIARHDTAGIRVNRSDDRNAVALQFADDRRPNDEEKSAMGDKAMRFDKHTKQWQRYDREKPSANLFDAEAVAKQFAEERQGRQR